MGVSNNVVYLVVLSRCIYVLFEILTALSLKLLKGTQVPMPKSFISLNYGGEIFHPMPMLRLEMDIRSRSYLFASKLFY